MIKYDMRRRAVPGFPGYSVTQWGEVYGLLRKTPMHPVVNGNGHLSIRAHVDKRARKLYLHRAVALAWIGPQPDEMHWYVLHGDGNPANNHASNVRWGTPSENSADAMRHGTIAVGSKAPNSKLTEDDVLMIRKLLSDGETQQNIADRFGVYNSVVSRIKTGKRWGWLK